MERWTWTADDLASSPHVVGAMLDDPLSLSTHFALFSQGRLRPAGGTSVGRAWIGIVPPSAARAAVGKLAHHTA